MEATPKKRKQRGPSLTESTRKRRKAERLRKSNLNRISIGTQFERWVKFKEEAGLKTHADVAESLLDHECTLSADEIRKVKEVKTTTTGRQIVQKASSSFVDPMNIQLDKTLLQIDIILSIDVSLMSDTEDQDQDDPDYVPEFEMTAVLEKAAEGLKELAFEEIEFNMEQEEDEDVEGTEEGFQEGVRKIKDLNECESLVKSVICLTFTEQLKVLANTSVTKCVQEKCETPSMITLKEEYVGSAVYLRWVCESGHIIHSWCSKAVLNRRVHSGDFLTCVSILTSGNNFGKLAMWAQHLNLKFPTATFFHNVQRCYIIPTVNSYWEEQQTEVLNSFKDKDVIVLGDGRNDSPGHSAQYCSYTLMEENSKKILTIQTLDKRTTELKSTSMEKKVSVGPWKKFLIKESMSRKLLQMPT